MKIFKLTGFVLLIMVLVATVSGQSVANKNIDIKTFPDKQVAPKVLISSFGLNDITNSQSLSFVELYNQSDKPIDITNWNFTLNINDANSNQCHTANYHAASTSSDGWVRSKDYFSFFMVSSVGSTSSNYAQLNPSEITCSTTTPQTARLSLLNADNDVLQSIDIKTNDSAGFIWKQHQRDYSPRTTRKLTSNFETDYSTPSSSDTNDNGNFVAYSRALYHPPKTANGIKIIEILPHAKSCLPWNNDPLCKDYIKLYRSKNNHAEVNPAEYTLIYKSKHSDTVHKISLLYPPAPGHYSLINTDNDGDPISLTNSGGFVWLEDAGNVVYYQDTAMSYPSASSNSYVGKAYVLNNNSWRWTSTPQPFSANKITPLNSSQTSADNYSLKPCDPDQYRNPSTNRCKLKGSTDSLVPCHPGQYRNPATNRCKSLAANSNSLKPCDPDQYRNPATNRCKSKSSSTKYKPCKPGWQRNPETHRCRKSSAVKGDSTGTINDVNAPSKNSGSEWIVAIAILVAAISYAAYEWRSELAKLVRRAKQKIT